MIISRVSSKAQTTLPRAVRTALGIKDGDQLAYEIRADTVILTKVKPPPGDPFTVFEEWTTEADARAFAKL